MTTNASNGTSAMVGRSKRFLAVAALALFVGSSVAWAVVLSIAPLGSYDVALHMDDGRFAIVLDRRAPSDGATRDGDPGMNDDDGLHDEYTVTVATLDACSTADSGKHAMVCEPAITVQTIDIMHRNARLSCAASSRAGPLKPACFAILRI